MATQSTFSWLTGVKNKSQYAGKNRKPARQRRLAVESLEDRSVPAVLTVNSLLDLDVNLTDATVTLRDAVAAAETDAAISPGGPVGVDADTIVFAPALFAGGPQTINLSKIGDDSASNGDSAFKITTPIVIQGPTGANGLTLAGPGNTGNVDTTMRLFLVTGTGNLTVDHLTLTGGRADAAADGPLGGAILNFGTVNLTRCTVTGSSASTGGGGLFNKGTASVGFSTFSNNSATFSSGGAIFNSGGLTVVNSTFSGNASGASGGAILNGSLPTHTLTLTNSTLTGNHSGEFGGGLNGVATEHLFNTIIAGNFRGTTPDDIDNSIDTAFNNLIGTGGSGGIVNGVNGNKVGVNAASVLDPTLAFNGGPTKTHALIAGANPAFDAGNNSKVPAEVTTDQRGLPRLIGTVDIGAVEVQSPPAITGPSSGVRGQPHSFNVSASNVVSVDPAAGFEYKINWGDGSPVQTIARTAGNGNGVTPEHIYTSSGEFTVTVTATDKDNATSSAATHIISIVAVQMQGNDLVVGGTTGNDRIAIKAGADGAVKVLFGGVSQGSFSPTGKIVVYGQAGDDNIQVANRVALPAILYGEAGNDTLRGTSLADQLWGGDGDDKLFGRLGDDFVDGGEGDDVIVGGAGNDNLLGLAGDDNINAGPGNDQVFGHTGNDRVAGGAGDDSIFTASGDDRINAGPGDDLVYAGGDNDRVNGGGGDDVLLGTAGNDTLSGSLGRDLLIGGADADTLIGSAGDDILMAGTTAFDGSQTVLAAIMAEWTSARTYAERVANLKGVGTGPRANGDFFLKVSGPDVTVFDEAAVNMLSGASGTDWYFANLSGSVLDTISSLSGSEIVEELPL